MVITNQTNQSNPVGALSHNGATAMGNFESLAFIKLALLIAVGVIILSGLSDSPYIAILILDLLFCGCLVRLFESKYRYLFLLHVPFIYASSQLFTSSFLDAGDGIPYAAVIRSYFNSQDLFFYGGDLLDVYNPLQFFKYASLGAVPIFVVPEFFFGNPPEEVYALWQITFHVFLSLIVISLAQMWRVMEGKYLFAIALFVVISPTFLGRNLAPSRHVVTFFGVFLLLIAHLAIIQKVTLFRVVCYVIAVVMVLISKAPLMMPYFIFVIFDLFIIQVFEINRRNILLLLILILGLFFMSIYFVDVNLAYDEISKGGASTFSSFTQIPIIGWVIKYVYALLSPFPWSSSPQYIYNNFRGNWLMFFMHIFSALTGLYLFFIVILKSRFILDSDMQIKQLVAFSLIMSLSILKGSTGFHEYLALYFPMLAPLLTIKKLQINPMLPVGFVIIMEAFMALVK
jgi:hypothetical protein